MKYVWETNNEPKLLEVEITAKKPQQVIIAIEDVDRPNTFYNKHETVIKGTELFEFSLPISPKKAFFEISANKNNLPWGGFEANSNISFKIKELPFTKKCPVQQDGLLSDFLRFSSWISQNAGVLYAAYNDDKAVYTSNSGNFTLRYVPEILDDEPFVYIKDQQIKNANYGNPLPTSFRIHTKTKAMELSQKYVITYTVPQRMVLFAHEFAHGWLNKDADNEFEADYNSLLICRCLGFSKREIGDAYAQVFLRAALMYPADENAARMKAILSTLDKMN